MYIYVYVCCICCFKCCLWMCNVSCIYHVSSVPSFLLYSKYAWGQSFWSFIHRFLVMSQTPPFRAPLFLHRNEPCSVIQSCDVDDMLRRTTRCTPTTNEPCHTSDHSHRLASTTNMEGCTSAVGRIDVWNSRARMTQMMSVLVDISRTSSQFKSSCFITTRKEGVFTHPKLVLWVIFLWI